MQEPGTRNSFPSTTASGGSLVCLVRPRAVEGFRFSAQSLSPPLGLAYIAAALEASGRRVVVVDALGEAPEKTERYFDGYLMGLSDEEVAARIPEEALACGVGVTFTHEWPAAARLIGRIRAARPGLKIFLGGEHTTCMPEFCLAVSQADAAVLGEGEETVIAWIDAIENGSPLACIEGLAFREGNEILVNPRRRRRADVDAIPFPAWHHFPLAAYHRHGLVGGVRSPRLTLPVLATRGCPYRCTFCTSPRVWGTRWIPRDPARVADELAHLKERYGAGNFVLQDLTPLMRKEWILRFCAEILNRGLDITFEIPTGSRAEAVDLEAASTLRRAGLAGISFAPESGSEATRRLVGKRLSEKRFLAGVEASVAAGLKTSIFLIVGFPHEDKTALSENLSFVDRLRSAGATDLSLGYYMALPGSELFEELYDRGRIRIDRSFFSQIPQSSKLYPSQSHCEGSGRAGLFLWQVRLYARFYLGGWSDWIRLRPLRAIYRGFFGTRRGGDGSKLPDAIRHAVKTAWASGRARFGRRWMDAKEERRLFDQWDAVFRGLQRQRAERGCAKSAPPGGTPFLPGSPPPP